MRISLENKLNFNDSFSLDSLVNNVGQNDLKYTSQEFGNKLL